ncbi:peptidase M14, carboxypeptidase A [Psychromonas ingrahamii 37]|uniref:carboxypeptidase T n=1 Tax=Psychromonas ingrahamii (strain DSM 17664 / CCUG 51855 / 37) TaxID=357804 RepID=A1SXH3_PSYIN|nr:M14 family zinc carboxypeptidase [Psychromonas ingrahamii]ABM04188.1 peptidase M14, carboxypeptidase A [Psychromonas ingrahamii 37]
MKKQYVSYQETIDFLNTAATLYPDLIKVQSIGETWEKRPIMMATISMDVANADTKPALLYTGTIHAREWIGIELANNFIKYIIDNYQFNPKLQQALTLNTLYIVPCLNPDGFEFSRTHFSFWRKNRRDNGDSTFGVDLNRNFGVRFKTRSDTSSNTYSGPSGFSEPETCAIRDFVETHKNITIALDYHSQGNVFFPAHKFNHEAEIDTTDLNTLCANMAFEIEKVTGRKYGIHRGKPPTNLINGSAREYYYNRGILSTVVEVGTKNIPDYMENMSESINENIPALVHAFGSAINYSHLAPKRVDNFNLTELTENSISLAWEYSDNDPVYFEIYRSISHKSPCSDDNLVGITKSLFFTDVQLKSGRHYFYKIRAVDQKTKIKGPYAPELKLNTLLARDRYSKTLFPASQDIGYVGQYTPEKNQEHFGLNSLFIGVNKSRGICYGVIAFSLDRLPDDASIKEASFSLYPMNRVSAKIEGYGEWGISFLEASSVPNIRDYNDIANATVIHSGQTIESDHVTQGVWCVWHLNGKERDILQEQLKMGTVLMRIDGPTVLPKGNDSQIMQFDIGYGRFGSGIHYRPNLHITYSRQPETVEVYPTAVNTISEHGIVSGSLQSGYDENGHKIYAQLAFSLHSMPDPEKTVITDAYLELENTNALSDKKDIRFTVELAEFEDVNVESIKQRKSIQYIGYEVGYEQLRYKTQHFFNFDTLSRTELERFHLENKQAYFIIRATSALKNGQGELIKWLNDPVHEKQAKLVIQYIERAKVALQPPGDIKTSIENSKTKITWENPKSKDFLGSFVVRNCFHPPRTPFDGVKIYAGQDTYTYDSFGNPNIPKYYSIFSYDDVPNYSIPACIHFSVEETIPVIEIDPEEVEMQGDEEMQSSADNN